MKKNIVFSAGAALSGLILCLILFAFTARPGAHSVQVYLDGKKVIDQYINQKTDAPELTLDASENHTELVVKYSECGRTVTGRKLTIKDSDNKILKEWKFDGAAAGFAESMPCKVKDVLALKQKKNNTLKLYYSSSDFPEGQQIAYLLLNSQTTTASK